MDKIFRGVSKSRSELIIFILLLTFSLVAVSYLIARAYRFDAWYEIRTATNTTSNLENNSNN